MSNRRSPSRKRIADELLVGFDPHVEQTWRPILIDQVRLLQNARTPQDFADVHIDLLARFAARQDVAAERRAAGTKLRTEQRVLASQSPKPKTELRRIQDLLAAQDRLDFRDGILQHVARCIADGLVWKLVAADRRALTILGDGQRVGRLPDGGGFATERARIESHAAAGRVAIHNDLTNCLREADLTTFGPAWPPKTIGLEEVKSRAPVESSNRATDRLTRQSDRLNRKLAVLRDNYDPHASQGEGALLLRLPIPYRTHLSSLGEIISRARRDGHATGLVAEGIHLSAVDYTAVADVQQLGNWQIQGPIAAWGSLDPGRRVQGSSFARRYEDRLSDHRSYQAVAPVSLLPLGAEAIVDILLGRIDLCVTYRFDAIEASLAARGIRAVCAGPGAWNERFLVANRKETTVTVPPHLAQQLTHELMTVETLTDIVEALVDLADRDTGTVSMYMVFCDELGAWPGLVR